MTGPIPCAGEPALTLVLPVFDGERILAGTLRAAWEWLERREEPCELLVVDDGSADATPLLLERFAAALPAGARTSFRSLRNAVNRGKGYALRRAFLHARGVHVVFTDADLTYPLDNLDEVVGRLEAGADVVFGNRLHADSRYVVAPSFFGKLFTRHVLGRAFNVLVRALVVPGVRDTQAGLKGFRRDAARLLAARVRLPRFSFDVELLFAARRLGLSIADCPVRFLYRKEPSTVRFVRDSFAMLRDMIVVRLRGARGAYGRDASEAELRELLQGSARPLDVAPAPPAVASPRPGALGKSG